MSDLLSSIDLTIIVNGRRLRPLTFIEFVSIQYALDRNGPDRWMGRTPVEYKGKWYWDEGPHVT
jgi:hypothetical protein